MNVLQTIARFRRPGQLIGSIVLGVGLATLIVPIAASGIRINNLIAPESVWSPGVRWLSECTVAGVYIAAPLILIGIWTIGFTRTAEEKAKATKHALRSMRQSIGGL